jgi:hypothetical protein
METKLKKMTYLFGGGSLAFNVGDFKTLVTPKTTGTVDPQQIVVNAINYSLFFIGALALIFVVYGGILFVTSGGDAEKTTKARNTLLYAIIGIIVVVLAYVLINWIAGSGAGTLTNPS